VFCDATVKVLSYLDLVTAQLCVKFQELDLKLEKVQYTVFALSSIALQNATQSATYFNCTQQRMASLFVTVSGNSSIDNEPNTAAVKFCLRLVSP